MVKRILSIATVGGIAVVSACFGDGPMPSTPTDATILFTSEPAESCLFGTYIGPVAVGSNQGYVSFLQYQPTNNCGGGGGGNPSVAQTVFSFNLEGGTLTMLGSAGQSSSGSHVQVAANGSAGAWVYNEPGQQNTIVAPSGAQLGGTMGMEFPLGIASLGGDVYVGTATNLASGGNEVNNPTYPSGGTLNSGGAMGSIWKVGSNGSAAVIAAWAPECGGIDRCMVAGGSALAYIDRPTTGAAMWRIMRLELSGSAATPTSVASQTGGGDAPFGLDADDQYIAYSTTQTCNDQMMGNSNCTVSDCNIGVYDTTATMPAAKTLLSTTQFACVDAKLADGYVYFAIVGVYHDDNSMYGRGIGRVKIADRTLETVDLGIRGPYAGPRRIFPVGDELFLVDPLVMARIPKTALDGKQDFTP